jgi:RNA polymerase sigma-70 factor (ECF subfamily)
MPVQALRAAQVDDATLIERVKRGDEGAFTQLYQRHARYIAGVVYRLTGVDGELDDIVQETFVEALRKVGQLREPDRVRSWLVAIAVRRTHRALQVRRRRRWFGLRVAEVSPSCADPRVRQVADELYDALDRLSPKLRIPWVLHHIEDQTLPEVAQHCDVSLATAKRRIADADERLDRRLHET